MRNLDGRLCSPGGLSSSDRLCSQPPLDGMASSSSASSHQEHDYTEGASAIDIQNALASSRRSRRDSQYDGDGYMFDGPGHSVNPSSVSRMSLSEHGRKSSEWSRTSDGRRKSEDRGRATSRSRSRRGSQDTQRSASREQPSQDREDDERSTTRRSRRKSAATSPQRSTVFENIAQMFGRAAPTAESPPRSRRPSLSSRSSRVGILRRGSSRRSDAGSDYALESEDEDQERWGYSSGEEYDSESDIADERRERDTGSMDYHMSPEDSFPPSPGMALHIMTGDPIFGDEARIDMGELDLFEPPPPGPPSRQTIYIADEDVHVRFVGYETVPFRQFIWRCFCVLSFGILGLLGHWFPRLWLRWVAREKAFKNMDHGFLVIEVSASLFLLESIRNNTEDCLQGYRHISNKATPLSVPH